MNFQRLIPTSAYLNDAWNALWLKPHALYSHYVEPHLTKANVDSFIVGSLCISSYYTMVGGTSAFFLSRAGLAMGFKLFMSTAGPAVSQTVESVTDSVMTNAKYSYHSLGCLVKEQHCNTLLELESPKSNILVDFAQFNVTQYYQDVSQEMSKLTLNSLLFTGTVSASASFVKDITYDFSGFEAYCQNYFCKNWISYYYKEGIKNVLKSLADLKDKIVPSEPQSELAPDQGSKPLSIDSIIDHKTQSIFENDTSSVRIESNNSASPLQVSSLLSYPALVAQTVLEYVGQQELI